MKNRRRKNPQNYREQQESREVVIHAGNQRDGESKEQSRKDPWN